MKRLILTLFCLFLPLFAEEEQQDFLLSEEEAEEVSNAIESTYINFDLIGMELPQGATILGNPHASGGIFYGQSSGSYVPLTAGGDFILETQVVSPEGTSSEEAQPRPSVISNIEDLTISIQEVSVPSNAILSTAQVMNTLTSSSSDSGVQDPKTNGSNFGGSASGGGGTGVLGLSDENEYQTLILDGFKNLNINKRYLKILYGNDTPYWDEDYSIPLVSFDIGTLIYNGITLDDTYELEHGIDYKEFIYNVMFPTLDPEYIYRLELNNGAVFLWAKLPDAPPVPESKVGMLVLLATFFVLKRKRS